MGEREKLNVVRVTLGAALPTDEAATLLAEAMRAHLSSAEGRPDVLTMVRGPLRGRLVERLGARDAEGLVRRIEGALGVGSGEPTAPYPAVLPDADVPTTVHPSADDPPQGESTRSVPVLGKIVRVAVLSTTDRLTRQLRDRLDGERVRTRHHEDLQGLLDRLDHGPPGLVVVDAADFPAIEPADVADALAGLPKATLRAVYGYNLPYGASVINGLAEASLETTGLDHRDGLDPLIDLIRSRLR